MRSVKALSLMVLLAAGALCAQSWQGPATLGLQVTQDDGQPIAGAAVILQYLETDPPVGLPTIFTDLEGRVALRGLAQGEWQLDVRSEGHMLYTGVIMLRRGKLPKLGFSSQQRTGSFWAPLEVDLFEVAERPPTAPRRPLTQPPTVPGAPAPEPPRAEASRQPQPDEPAESSPPQPTSPEAPEASEAEQTPAEAPEPTAIEPESTADGAAEDPEPTLPPPEAQAAPPPQPEPEARPAPAPPAAAGPKVPSPEAPAKTPAPPATGERPPAAPQPPSAPEPSVPSAPEVPETPEPQPAPGITPPEDTATVFRRAAAYLRSSRHGTCPECQPGEWSTAAQQTAGTGVSSCAVGLDAQIEEVAQKLARPALPAVARFAGPLSDPRGGGLLDLLDAATRTALRERLAPHLDPSAPCQLVAAVIPRDARYVGFRYEASDTFQSGDCLPERECPVGQARWLANPGIQRTPAFTLVWALFQNRSTDLDRQARLTVYFKPPQGWTPLGFR